MRQDAVRNRERILGAAEDVFGELGPAGSTDEVARRAGVGIATVFRHFPTKEALIEAALVRHFDQLTAQARGLSGGSDAAGSLRTLIRVMIETGSTKMTLASLLGAGGNLPPGAIQASHELRDAVEVLLRAAQDAGKVRPTVTVDELYLIIRGLAQAAATAGFPEGTAEGAVTIVLSGLESR
ncbi:MAG: TetR/AcrR family transcriptional regulator [Actinomycetia bacterium]|nr:TetR/AcrR family transcriptional regulator [Actinomycetes bacterium]